MWIIAAASLLSWIISAASLLNWIICAASLLNWSPAHTASGCVIYFTAAGINFLLSQLYYQSSQLTAVRLEEGSVDCCA